MLRCCLIALSLRHASDIDEPLMSYADTAAIRHLRCRLLRYDELAVRLMMEQDIADGTDTPIEYCRHAVIAYA